VVIVKIAGFFEVMAIIWYIVLTFKRILLLPLSVLIVETAEYTVIRLHGITSQKTAIFIIFITLLYLLCLVYENVNKRCY